MTTASSKHPETADESEGSEPQAVSLKTRLVAWWEGYDVPGGKQRKAAAAERDGASGKKGPAHGHADDQASKPGLNRFGKPLWTANRLEVAEKIWGTGYTGPGGDELIATLAKPLGLNPAMTVLEVGCGLGGATRCLSKQFGSWTTGLDCSPFLVEQGMVRSTKAGLAKQAPVQLYDPENAKYGKRVDAVFSRETFFTIRNKTGIFEWVKSILKPRGQFLLTDYVITPEARNAPAIKAWSDREPMEPQLWTLEGALAAFTQSSFDLRIHEDITESHLAIIVSSIRALTDHLEKHHMDKETKVNVIDEVETWAQKVSALHAGLRCYRFYALKTGE